MTDGYLYCFSNPSMPNILKVGMTERTPEERLNEANRPNTFMPMPFKIEIAKKVINPKQKEKTLHTLLTQYTTRTNPRREFFHVSPEEIKIFFDLIDGELWVEKQLEQYHVPLPHIYPQVTSRHVLWTPNGNYHTTENIE